MSETKTTTVLALLQDIDAATARMGMQNPHKRLLLRCGAAVIELARRTEGLEPQYLMPPNAYDNLRTIGEVMAAEPVEGVPV